MADKKKKIFLSKESSAPRRPVILKSDRDTTKEQTKEKEKDKQPTIILKTREQSTPKEERPQSPSIQTADSEGPQPSKIAQNENKEKKTIGHIYTSVIWSESTSTSDKTNITKNEVPQKTQAKEQKPSAPLKLMSEPVKLLDENLEFNTAALEFLQDSSVNYLVVGIMGTQGVGKSMILNLIAQNTPIPDLCTQILNSHELTTRHTFESNDVASIENQMDGLNFLEAHNNKVNGKVESSFFKFKMQDIEQIERGVHCTKGIDMYVTSDRVILLDCQALWSPSLLEETSINPITARSANMVTVDCLQVASFLMAICHVLIAIQDWFTDYNFLRYIQAAEMLKPSLSASSASPEGEASGGESHPHLLLLHNRCQLEDYSPRAVKALQDLYRKAFQKSSLQLTSGMYMYSDANKNGLGVDSSGCDERACGPPLNLLLLPEIYDDFHNREIYRGHPTFEQLAKRLRWMVLGVHRHAITNVPNLSERSWFQYCNKAWETIRKCTFFMEYERFLP